MNKRVLQEKIRVFCLILHLGQMKHGSYLLRYQLNFLFGIIWPTFT
jgi:hypothetical protein